jgi:cytoskeletal protein CcmA (bactofilin family)
MLFNKRPENNSTLVPVGAVAAGHVPATVRKPTPVPAVSHVDASLSIVGDLRTDGDIHVYGQVCGDIQCAQLIVGPNATITGDVTAEEAVVRGRVKGNIRATRVVLQETAHVESNIFYGRLMVDEGAILDGQSHRCQDPVHPDGQAVLQDAVLDGEPSDGSGVALQVVNGEATHADLSPAQS